jgi:hypothetical protein
MQKGLIMRAYVAVILGLSCAFLSNKLSAQQISPVDVEQELPFKKIIFKVLDPKSGEELAWGEETIDCREKILKKSTQYYQPGTAKKVIQTESSIANLENLQVKEYKFSNDSTGERVELTMPQPPVAELVYVEKPTKPPERSQYKWTDRTIIGKTLHHYIVRKWNDIIRDTAPDFDLFVPMKRDYFGFRLRKERETKYRGQLAQVISLEPKNWAIRKLVPRMHFHYVVINGIPQLVHYEGATTVAINGDETREVAIDFSYER